MQTNKKNKPIRILQILKNLQANRRRQANCSTEQDKIPPTQNQNVTNN